MAINKEKYFELLSELALCHGSLVAVSKTKPVEDILALHELGQLDFGENYVQEMKEKRDLLPQDIHWHFIGHLQSNKVKQIAPFVHLIHGIDSLKLMKETDRQAKKNDRIIDILLQVHIARESTKFGMDETELAEAMDAAPEFQNLRVSGLMGMASFSEDQDLVRTEFRYLKSLFDKYAMNAGEGPEVSSFRTLSMGMSDDYKIALQEGANMIRIGSLIFGAREKTD
jgi:pyridoxal phosphate enzyme (YggS family)